MSLSTRQRQAIDCLLEGKSDEFRATVLELCRQLGWPDDEPGFLLAIASGQLQALMQHYPERITQAMRVATAELQSDWQRLQVSLMAQGTKSVQTAQVIEARLHDAQQVIEGELNEVEALLGQEREQFKATMQAELAEVRAALAQEQRAMVERAMALAEEQKGVISAHTKDLIAQGIVATQKRSDQQVATIVSAVRRKHYVEAGLWAIGAALSLVVASGTIGWMGRGLAEQNSVWADIERWNQNHLQACIEAQRTTCNFHIEVPQAE